MLLVAAIVAVLVMVVLYLSFSPEEAASEEGDDDYGICGNIKFVTNTFADATTSKDVCAKLGKPEGCLDGAKVKTWGPTCADVEFEAADGPLYASGGCSKFAERRADGRYHQCQATAAFSRTCEANTTPCDVPGFINREDDVVNLLPCPQIKGTAGPRGVESCAAIDLAEGATCADYVERPVEMPPDDDKGLLASRKRAEVQLWTRCEEAGAGRCRASAAKCARVLDSGVVDR